MGFSQFDVVVLIKDLPFDGLKSGTKGVIVDVYSFPAEGYEVELIGSDGRTLTHVGVLPEYLALVADPNKTVEE